LDTRSHSGGFRAEYAALGLPGRACARHFEHRFRFGHEPAASHLLHPDCSGVGRDRDRRSFGSKARPERDRLGTARHAGPQHDRADVSEPPLDEFVSSAACECRGLSMQNTPWWIWATTYLVWGLCTFAFLVLDPDPNPLLAISAG